MAKPKSVLLRVEIDEAQKAHNCQHNQAHRLQRGDKRLKVTKDRTDEHFCSACGLKMIERAIETLSSLAAQLRGEDLPSAQQIRPAAPP